MLTSPADAEDVLSATRSTLKLKALNTTTIDAGGRWAIELPAVAVLRLHVVLSGECWLSIVGEKGRHHFKAGDCFLLPHEKGLVMASDLSIKKRLPLHRIVRSARDGVVRIVCNE